MEARNIFLLCLASFKLYPCCIACISNSFLFIGEQYSNVWLYHNLSIHLLVDLESFPNLLPIVYSAAVNTCVHVFVWVPVFSSLGCIPSSWIVGSFGNFMLKFWGNTKLFSTVAESFYIPPSHVQGGISPHPYQHLFSFFKSWPF